MSIMDYYDLVLGLIPGSFVAGIGALSIFGIDMTTAIPAAAALSVGIIGHALFVRAPDHGVDAPHDEPPRSPPLQPAD